MSRRVFRYEVPVDDGWHTFNLRGPVVYVAARDPRAVEFWAIHDDTVEPQARAFTVVGTGHPVPEQAGEHIGGAITAGGAGVWHLFEQRSRAAA